MLLQTAGGFFYSEASKECKRTGGLESPRVNFYGLNLTKNASSYIFAIIGPYPKSTVFVKDPVTMMLQLASTATDLPISVLVLPKRSDQR